MERLRKYATATDVYFRVVKRGVVDHGVGADWTPVAGDVKVVIDGGAATNVATLPSAIAAGNGAVWKQPLSAGELTGKKISLEISDSATKAIEDTGFEIVTFGHANAEYVQDLNVAFPANFSALSITAGGLVDITQAAADKVWATAARTLTSFGFAVDISAAAVSLIWDKLVAGIVTANSIGKRIVDFLDAAVSSRSAHSAADVWAVGARTLTDKTGFSLTAGERTAIANEVESQIIDETDSEKVLTAITDKIAAVNPSLAGLTLASIATAVRDKAYAGSAAGSIGEAIAAMAARMPGAGTLSTLDAAAVRAAVGLAANNLDTQLAAIAAKVNALPADPADASDIAALLAEIDGVLADLQAAVGAVPTAIENADALLDRNMATGLDSGTENVRTVRQALRANRNRVSLVTGQVFKEDDAAVSHTFAVTTDPAADPVTAINPTGGG